jgi:hypothetical protein
MMTILAETNIRLRAPKPDHPNHTLTVESVAKLVAAGESLYFHAAACPSSGTWQRGPNNGLVFSVALVLGEPRGGLETCSLYQLLRRLRREENCIRKVKLSCLVSARQQIFLPRTGPASTHLSLDFSSTNTSADPASTMAVRTIQTNCTFRLPVPLAALPSLSATRKSLR